MAFFSKSLNPAEQKYNIYDKELLAIKEATKFFKHYLLGARHQIRVHSDHDNLKYFKSTHKVTPRQARWMNHLTDYNFIIYHLPGKQNTIADLLSWRKDLGRGVNNTQTTVLPNNLFLQTTYLPNNPQKQKQILRNIHDAPTEGHPRISNTLDLVKQKYHGPKLREYVEQYIKGCAKCQESKTFWLPHAPLHHFDTPTEEGPFQYVPMHFITDLPKSKGYDTILTIVDQGCSKVTKFIPCNKEITREGVAELYLQHLFPWYGIPKCIISDRDPRFTGNFVKTLCKAIGIKQNLSTAFHPRTDGQSKCMNQWIKTYLRQFTNGWQTNWATYLPIAEFTHNSWKHEGMHFTPHYLIMGCNPQVNWTKGDKDVPAVEERLTELTKAREQAHQSLQCKQW